MNSKRAEEIMQSKGVINVNYNGMPVWIVGVRGEVAEVNLLGIERKMELPVDELTEGDPIHSVVDMR